MAGPENSGIMETSDRGWYFSFVPYIPVALFYQNTTEDLALCKCYISEGEK
jgi:hypothetical protein